MNDLKKLATTVDERLAELYDAQFSVALDGQFAETQIRRASRQERTLVNGDYQYAGTLGDAISTCRIKSEQGDRAATRALTEWDKVQKRAAQIKLETRELDAVWREERWTRAFLVINSNGHIHSSVGCPTCYTTTRYEWLTAYSADDETTIVEAAGETACTVCYPTAPAEILNRPSTIQSKARAAREAAATERAVAKAAREAKRKASAPTADGSTLMVPSRWNERNEEIKTERTARSEWNSAQDDIEWKRSVGRLDKAERDAERQRLIEEALAGKYGVSALDMREELLAKYKKRR